MISFLSGILKHKSPTDIVLDVNGVGYAIHISLSTFGQLGEVGEQQTILTHLQVREDAMLLYGFSTAEERNLFRMLISVSGIGPRIAQGILSGLSAVELKGHLASGNISALTAIPGVGKKTAERMILELKDKVVKSGITPVDPIVSATNADVRNEALLALTSLGYQRIAAEKALRAVLNESPNSDLSLEMLLKKALRYLS